MNDTVYAYCYVELLTVEALRDAESGESRVGLTIARDEDAVSVCLSVPDALRLLGQLNQALAVLAGEG